MKKTISLVAIFSLALPLIAPVGAATVSDSQFPAETAETIFVQRRGGGGGRVNRGSRGGNRPARANRGNREGLNRSQLGSRGSGRVNRDRANRPRGENRANRGNFNLNRDRAGSNRVNRDRARNIDRERARDRARNIDRERVRNRVDRRDFNLSNDRNFSNRVNRNLVNINRRNVVVNPRGWEAWGWNNGVAWAPNYNYWGGGFWGPFAAGALATGLTTAVINAATADNQPTYVIIDSNSPGNTLFSSYGLTQIQCTDDDNIVVIYGPQNSVICTNPNSNVPAGIYDINPSDLTLITRY
jgi:hypothetical protein